VVRRDTPRPDDPIRSPAAPEHPAHPNSKSLKQKGINDIRRFAFGFARGPRDVRPAWGMRPVGAAQFPTHRGRSRGVGGAAGRSGPVPHASRPLSQCVGARAARRSGSISHAWRLFLAAWRQQPVGAASVPHVMPCPASPDRCEKPATQFRYLGGVPKIWDNSTCVDWRGCDLPPFAPIVGGKFSGRARSWRVGVSRWA
jgi:hypothetical protein